MIDTAVFKVVGAPSWLHVWACCGDHRNHRINHHWQQDTDESKSSEIATVMREGYKATACRHSLRAQKGNKMDVQSKFLFEFCDWNFATWNLQPNTLETFPCFRCARHRALHMVRARH